MNKHPLVIITTATLFTLLLGAAPALAEKAEEAEENAEAEIPESIRKDPTGVGSPRTDPGVGRDRIPPGDPAPTGMEKEYRLLDSNQDGTLDEDELSERNRPAEGQRDVQQYDFDQYDANNDGVISRGEFWLIWESDEGTAEDDQDNSQP